MTKWKITYDKGCAGSVSFVQDVEAERWYDQEPWTYFVGPDKEGTPIIACIATRVILVIERLEEA